MADLHNLLGELRQFVDAVAGENRPSREWAIDLRTKIDAIPERALAERAGGVKVLREAALMLLSEIDAAGDINSIVGASNPLRKALHALTTEPVAPEGQQEPVAWEWAAFEEEERRGAWTPCGYGDEAGWKALVKRNPAKYRVETRPLYTRPSEQAVTEAMVEAAVQAVRQYTRDTLLIDEHRELVRTALKAAMEAGR